MLAYTPWSKKDIALIVQHIEDFLKFLRTKKSQWYHINDYVTAAPEYQKRAYS